MSFGKKTGWQKRIRLRRMRLCAAIGHVEQAWDCSFRSGKTPPQIQKFENTLKRLIQGYPVAAAMGDFNSGYEHGPD